MGKQYIENKWAWIKKQKRISDLIIKKNEWLSTEEKLELAYDKYYKQEKIAYDEYVMMLMTNDEIWFCLNNTEYQVIHESSESTMMYITEYSGNQKVSEREEVFTSTIELLDKFKIQGKRICDNWNEITFS